MIFKPPLTPQRSWETYLDPAEADAEALAQPFTRIVDAAGETVFTAHDLFEFRPGHAEAITTAVNLHGELVAALAYARQVIDTLSEKAHGKADRIYCMDVLKEGNSIDAVLRKVGEA